MLDWSDSSRMQLKLKCYILYIGDGIKRSTILRVIKLIVKSLLIFPMGFICCRFIVTIVDMAPDFAGTIMGISNSIANFNGFIQPMIVGQLTNDHVIIIEVN